MRGAQSTSQNKAQRNDSVIMHRCCHISDTVRYRSLPDSVRGQITISRGEFEPHRICPIEKHESAPEGSAINLDPGGSTHDGSDIDPDFQALQRHQQRVELYLFHLGNLMGWVRSRMCTRLLRIFSYEEILIFRRSPAGRSRHVTEVYVLSCFGSFLPAGTWDDTNGRTLK